MSGNLLQFVKRLLDASVSSTAALLSVADNEHLLANIDFAKDVIAARSVHNKDQTASLRSSVTKINIHHRQTIQSSLFQEELRTSMS